jgi:hypothetical protein
MSTFAKRTVLHGGGRINLFSSLGRATSRNCIAVCFRFAICMFSFIYIRYILL